ncbi:formate dehydrogenase subunit delta [Sphingosinicellaceae bacterium]|nr:formate dehydrogenase subunit delta [Sphingosinicellaceae bacterium]
MSATTIDRLVRMANQIAAEFDHQQPGNAPAATYDHLWHFWDPRMKAQILDHAAGGGDGLSPAAAIAVARLADGREPVSQTRATEFGADADGNTEGDAG